MSSSSSGLPMSRRIAARSLMAGSWLVAVRIGDILPMFEYIGTLIESHDEAMVHVTQPERHTVSRRTPSTGSSSTANGLHPSTDEVVRRPLAARRDARSGRRPSPSAVRRRPRRRRCAPCLRRRAVAADDASRNASPRCVRSSRPTAPEPPNWPPSSPPKWARPQRSPRPLTASDRCVLMQQTIEFADTYAWTRAARHPAC